MSPKRCVFFDLETAGLDPKRHLIIQIAADERRANKLSLRKNHYHPKTWAKEAQGENEVARGFADFLRRHAAGSQTSSKGEKYLLAQLVVDNSPARHWRCRPKRPSLSGLCDFCMDKYPKYSILTLV